MFKVRYNIPSSLKEYNNIKQRLIENGIKQLHLLEIEDYLNLFEKIEIWYFDE